MSTYRGPHVAVQQVFETSPGAIAVESLPSAFAGTPYEVYNKNLLADFNGVGSGTTGTKAVDFIVSGNNKVIYSENQGRDIFNQYPPLFYVRDTQNGEDYALDKTITSSGVSLLYTDKYILNNVVSSKARFPMFVKESGAGVTIDPATPRKITCSSGRFVDAGIVGGLQVVAYDSTNKVIGTVDYVESNTVMYLRTEALATGTFTRIWIGCNTVTQATVASMIPNRPAFLYDGSTNFNRLSIKRGDIIETVTSGFTDQIGNASIVNITSDNLIEIATVATATYVNYATEDPYGINNFYSNTGGTALFTVMVSEYKIKRLVGFAEKYDTNSIVASKSGNQLNLDTSLSMNIGDSVQVLVGSTRSDTYTIIAKTTDQVYLVDRDIVGTLTGDFYAWKTSNTNSVVENSVVASYRAVMVDNLGVVFKSSDNQLIGTNGVFGEASIYNDLAFMIQIGLGTNGGRVLYAVGVDPTTSLATVYGDALEALKFYDVYSHAIGTHDGGVNALLSSYCDEQSDPYEGHERIAVSASHEEDVYKLAETTIVSVGTTGLVTIVSGTVNLQAIGLGIGDKVKFWNDDDNVWETVTVQASPASATTVDTDWTGAVNVAGIVYFSAGTKSKQANRIAATGVGFRRVTSVWPGRFWADTQASSVVPAMTNVELPSYYLSALIAGMDGGQKVSQSFTRFQTALPGLSNIQLKTNSYFRKAELDIIGGGGVDILIQANPISNVIFSRHDLTTDMSAVEYRERSITKQADSAAKTLRSSVDPYIGKYNITNSLLKFLDQVMTAARNSIVKAGVLVDLQIKEIKRDPVIADKINILVKATVFVAGNYYDITMTVVSR